MALKKKNKGQGGFTLIELVSVVIILGILAAVIVPKYFDMTSRAQDAAYHGALNEGVARFNMAYAQYIMVTSQRPATLDTLQDSAYLGSALGSVNIGDYRLAYTAAGTSAVTIALSNSTGSALSYANSGGLATITFPWPN